MFFFYFFKNKKMQRMCYSHDKDELCRCGKVKTCEDCDEDYGYPCSLCHSDCCDEECEIIHLEKNHRFHDGKLNCKICKIEISIYNDKNKIDINHKIVKCWKCGNIICKKCIHEYCKCCEYSFCSKSCIKSHIYS